MMELPAVWANYISIAGFLFLAVVVWSIPRHLIYLGAPDQAKWRDIRIWAMALIVFQVSLYLVFT